MSHSTEVFDGGPQAADARRGDEPHGQHVGDEVREDSHNDAHGKAFHVGLFFAVHEQPHADKSDKDARYQGAGVVEVHGVSIEIIGHGVCMTRGR